MLPDHFIVDDYKSFHNCCDGVTLNVNFVIKSARELPMTWCKFYHGVYALETTLWSTKFQFSRVMIYSVGSTVSMKYIRQGYFPTRSFYTDLSCYCVVLAFLHFSPFKNNWVLWVLMVWCFGTRASVAAVMCRHPCVSICLWVKNSFHVNAPWSTLYWYLSFNTYC